jgi:hypothetical protein
MIVIDMLFPLPLKEHMDEVCYDYWTAFGIILCIISGGGYPRPRNVEWCIADGK